jgi:hypothetical protein
VIVATDKERNTKVKLKILKMKLNKIIYDLSIDASFSLKKLLVLKYDFYLTKTFFSRIMKILNVLLLNLFLNISEVTKNISLNEQKTLLSNNYYYKEEVFSEDKLYTVAKEIASHINEKHLKLTITNIQNIFSIKSYRQARKIYLFIKNNNLVTY